jgi:hypothetical protein
VTKSSTQAVCVFGWPAGVEKPAHVGIGTMPVVTARPHTHRAFSELPGDLHPAVQHLNPPEALLAGTGMLRNGDSGQEVKDAKALLVASGYKLDPTTTSSARRPKTPCVIISTGTHSLKSPASLDPATRAALKRDAEHEDEREDDSEDRRDHSHRHRRHRRRVTGFHIPWEVYAAAASCSFASWAISPGSIGTRFARCSQGGSDMAVMMGPNGKALPIATGAAAGMDGGGNRGESITSDTGNRPAAPREAAKPRESIAEPKDEVEEALSTPAPAPAPTQPAAEQFATDDEIDALHARFDQMEVELKRRLAVATLHARFDALSAWLAERFPG